MALGILVLITALSISAVAIYYSIAGLVAIFAAAAIPIIVMGTALEVGKLVTAVWLHKYWKQSTWWLKTYLTTAVVILMFITSMGIFGFLSKAHIEQTSASEESVALVEQLDKQIATQNAIILRASQNIDKIQNSGTGADQNIQAQIDKENDRISTAYDRVQPAIDETQKQLAEDTKSYTARIADVDKKLDQLATLSAIDTKDRDAVKLLQQLVGARPDGAYGSGTASAVKAYKDGLESEKQELYASIENLKSAANDEVKRLRARAEKEIDDSNTLIERLRSQLGQDTGTDIQAEIDAQNARIKSANTELDTLTEQKFSIEAEYRKLEAEVGPIKYIAEFVYGEQADKNMLEEAVRWVIIIIIVVFDPLAVLLLIASQYTFEFARRRKDDNGERLRQEYEQVRAEKIANNTGYTVDPQTTEEKVNEEESNQGEPGQPQQEDAETLLEREDQESVEREERDDPPLVEVEQEEEQELKFLQEEVQEDLAGQKKTIESLDELAQERAKEIEYLDSLSHWNIAKELWKEANPHDNLKTHKKAYIRGFIDKLPWEAYLPEEVFEDEEFVETHIPKTEGYIQNAEQSDDSIWKRIKDDKPDNTT